MVRSGRGWLDVRAAVCRNFEARPGLVGPPGVVGGAPLRTHGGEPVVHSAYDPDGSGRAGGEQLVVGAAEEGGALTPRS